MEKSWAHGSCSDTTMNFRKGYCYSWYSNVTNIVESLYKSCPTKLIGPKYKILKLKIKLQDKIWSNYNSNYNQITWYNNISNKMLLKFKPKN